MARTVVVSGGGTGIGRAIAAFFARAGEHVIIVGRRPEVLAKAAAELDGDVTAFPADLTQPDQVEHLAARIDRVDVLVNNAGGIGSLGTGGSLADHATAWRREFDTNVLTAVLLTTALRDRLARPGGRVILMSSIAALRGGGGAYSAAKAALHGWAYDLATALAPDITVNVVAPGFVADTEFFGDRMSPEGYRARVAQTLVGRAGAPEDIAATVGYLASAAGGFVTGQVIQVNGGALLGRG